MTDAMVVDQALLDKLTEQARRSPRHRQNFNFHASSEAKCHRLLNAVEPDAYIQPHRHLGEEKDETIVVIRGRFGCLFFDDSGRVTGQAVLGPGMDASVLNLPCGVFHTSISLEPGSVFFEAKAGPFVPATPDERASWAPLEGSEPARAYFESLRAMFLNDRAIAPQDQCPI